jgi:hypothetical protein
MNVTANAAFVNGVHESIIANASPQSDHPFRINGCSTHRGFNATSMCFIKTHRHFIETHMENNKTRMFFFKTSM